MQLDLSNANWLAFDDFLNAHDCWKKKPMKNIFAQTHTYIYQNEACKTYKKKPYNILFPAAFRIATPTGVTAIL